MTAGSAVETVYAKSNPEVRALHTQIMEALADCSELRLDAKKTSIHLMHRTAFGGLHPRKARLDVNIRLARALEGSRVASVEQVSRNRWHNLVRLERTDDIDAELLAWLREAYDLAA